MPWASILKIIIPWILRILGFGGMVAAGVDATALTHDPTWTGTGMSYTLAGWSGPSLAAIFASFLPLFQQGKIKPLEQLDLLDFVQVLQGKLNGVNTGAIDPSKLKGVLQILISLGEFAKMLLDKLPNSHQE